MKQIILTDKDININPNCHAEYFTISDDGELSLKPEYRGATTKSEYINSISDMGAGVAGSLNSELPSDLVIPEVVDEMAVDRLSSGMFHDNTAIETLTFPLTVDEIPEFCCHLAVNLRTLKNTEHIKKIGTRAFASCRLEKVIFSNLEELGGSFVFLYNPHIVYADLGNITAIPANTFTDNLALTKVKADDVKTVGNYAFINTARLVNADFIGSLTSIGKCGFWRSDVEFDWSSLTNCTFGDNATPLRVNPTDFWSELAPTACENPLPTKLNQCDKRWKNRTIGITDRTYYDGCEFLVVAHAICGHNNLAFTTVMEFEDYLNGVNPELLQSYAETRDSIIVIARNLGLTVNEYANWNKESLSALYEALASGGYALVEVGTIGGHANLVYGINEKKELMCLETMQKYFYDDTKVTLYTMPFHKFIANQYPFYTITK